MQAAWLVAWALGLAALCLPWPRVVGETRRALEFGSRKTYREDYDRETDAIADQEMWRVGHVVRGLRPHRK